LNSRINAREFSFRRSTSVRPQLSHCGVYARDISQMVDFYTRVVGLIVSDRSISSRGSERAFMPLDQWKAKIGDRLRRV